MLALMTTYPYRPEIDGLRAVAVTAVVLYHAGAPLSGGFTGVDVFFVLSGYLIGGLLWAELRATGRIALRAFWLRRLRRLAPAYLVMALAVAAVGALVLLPFEARETGKELIAATVWLSNVLFWRGAGYFGGASAEKPMLHTWSLSVEEQFYVALPLLLLALAWAWPRAWPDARPRAVVAALALAWAASLGATLLWTNSRPEAAFYLFPFRAWELLTGVLLAILAPSVGAGARAALGWAGVALILLGILGVRAEGFPGWQALVPVAGTAMALMGGTALRPLAWRGPVALGQLSYALYLWHWPVLVLAAYWRGGLGPWERAAWVGVALVLSWLSWRLIETPLRRAPGAGGVRTPIFLGGVALAGAAVLGLGAAFYQTDGLPGRFDGVAAPHIAASQDFLQDWSRCAVRAEGPFAGIEACAVGPEGPPRVLFWGDSHLRALMDGIAEAAEAEGVPGLIVWRAGCPPVGEVFKRESGSTREEDAACPATARAVLGAIAEADLARVVLVGRWAYYATGTGVGRDVGNTVRLGSPEEPLPRSAVPDPAQSATLGEALAGVAGAVEAMGPEVTILRQVPEMPRYDSREVARALVHGRLDEAGLAALLEADPGTVAARRAAGEAAIDGLKADGAMEVLDPWPLLCDDVCGVMHGGAAMYFDNNHLTNAGARLVAPLFAPLLRDARE